MEIAMPTTYECALACEMSSYQESRYYKKMSSVERARINNHERDLFQYGWQRLLTSEECNIQAHGYFGVAYCRQNQAGEVEVMIAHRGTCFGVSAADIGNILADIQIAKGEKPGILEEAAFVYARGLENYFRNTFGDNLHITHTGFSLGGFIAGANAALSDSPDVHAVTFDAPGIGALDFDREARAPHMTHYVLAPNLVNTCNSHVGQVRVMTDFLGSYDQSKAKPVEFELDLRNLGYGALASNASAEDRKRFRHTSRAQPEIEAAFREHGPGLGNIISSMEQARSLEPNYQNVYQWPVATNEMIYAENSPAGDGGFYSFGADNFWMFLLNAAATSVQMVKEAGRTVLWDRTKELNEDGIVVGIVGVNHSCPQRKIAFTAEEHQAHCQEMREREEEKERARLKYEAAQKRLEAYRERLEQEHAELLRKEERRSRRRLKLEEKDRLVSPPRAAMYVPQSNNERDGAQKPRSHEKRRERAENSRRLSNRK